MDLSDAERKLATYIFIKLTRDLENVRKGGRRYWELIPLMQELSNKGFAEATRFMMNIDMSRARELTTRTWTTKLQEGATTKSFRGARRQLQADPHSRNKTFGMRPHHARGEPDDSTEI